VVVLLKILALLRFRCEICVTGGIFLFVVQVSTIPDAESTFQEVYVNVFVLELTSSRLIYFMGR